ncbi:MAG: preprotein translocase subunit SecG [candidate division WOR-3 bacterium]|nr:MAG: preprotein translocase subunit SecG [candidate division WOR-3 bacterium]
MYSVIMFFHVLICILLIVVVLMQQTKGAGISSVFGGGGGTDALFGGKGATPFFVRLTTGLAIGFFVTSLTLVLLSRRPRPTTAVEKGMQEMPLQPGTGIPSEQPLGTEEGTMFPDEVPGGE